MFVFISISLSVWLYDPMYIYLDIYSEVYTEEYPKFSVFISHFWPTFRKGSKGKGTLIEIL